MFDIKICPLCGFQLSLKQINMKTAVYICEDLKCPYPVGYDCIEVERDIENIFDQTDTNIELDINNWVNDFYDKEISVDEGAVPVDIKKQSNTGDQQPTPINEATKEDSKTIANENKELISPDFENISGKNSEFEEFIMNFDMG